MFSVFSVFTLSATDATSREPWAVRPGQLRLASPGRAQQPELEELPAFEQSAALRVSPRQRDLVASAQQAEHLASMQLRERSGPEL